MPVYFILDANTSQIKIGRAGNIKKRLQNLQTGNPSQLQLMGWIKCDDDMENQLERELHQQYKKQRCMGEWFDIGPTEVLNELQKETGFVPRPSDSFEIIGFDKDAVPEYLGVCQWIQFEFEECCPFCGCLCGLHEQESTGMYHCINCDAYTNFDFLEDHEDNDDNSH